MPASAEVLDVAALDRLHRIGGARFVVEMIDLYLAHGPERLAAARAAAESGDHRALYRSAHSLKATSANLGASRIRDLAERLEAVLPGSGSTVLELVDELDRSFGQVRERLALERQRREATRDDRRGQR